MEQNPATIVKDAIEVLSKEIRFSSGEMATFKEALCLEAKKIQDSNVEQAKQTKALILWTKVMAFAVAAQVVVGGVQAFIYYKQLELLQANDVQTRIVSNLTK